MFIGVSGQILKDGNVMEFKDMYDRGDDFLKARHPRTVFGFDENNKMVLFTVDGRKKNEREGVNLRELSQVMKDNGIIQGFNVDGGGSTQAVFKNNGVLEYVNKGFLEPERTNANALLFVKRRTPKVSVEILEVNNGLNLNVDLSNNDFYKQIEVVKNGVSHFYDNLKDIITIDLRDNEFTAISVLGHPVNSEIPVTVLYNNYLKTSEKQLKLKLSDYVTTNKEGPFFYGEKIKLFIELNDNVIYQGLKVNGIDVSNMVIDNTYEFILEEDTYVEVMFKDYILPLYTLDLPDYIESTHEGQVAEGTLIKLKINLPINLSFISLDINGVIIKDLINNEYEFLIYSDTVVILNYQIISKKVTVSDQKELVFYLNQQYTEEISLNTNIILKNTIDVNRPIIINGNGYKISFSNNNSSDSNYLIKVSNTKDVYLNNIILVQSNKQLLVTNSTITVDNLTLNDFLEYGIEIIDNKSKIIVEDNIKTNTTDKPLIIIKNITLNDNYVVYDSLYEYIKDNDLWFMSEEISNDPYPNNIFVKTLMISISSIIIILGVSAIIINKRKKNIK